ncbi:MAG: NAD(P)-dependent alcohol dehydrogenase [Actinomycetota bacterium]|nr:NAD(P)-dependent alcohol dehydrogenase [Actinomycetota bacterium]
MKARGFAALKPSGTFQLFDFQRRSVGPNDVLIEIDYAGICHSDIHQIRQEWGPARFPMVPGHEIVGHVIEIGEKVRKFKKGDRAGVGVYINSCMKCTPCLSGMSQYCDEGMIETYNSIDRDGSFTYGGYSNNYVIDEMFAVKIPENLDFKAVAPLLCAGITLYSPLKHWKIGKDSKVAVLGLGGLGHMGVKIAAALGAEVTVFSHSEDKRSDALSMGARHFFNYGEVKNKKRNFDLILNTVSANLDLTDLIHSLKVEGSLVSIGIPPEPYQIHPGLLIGGRKSVSGSMIGSVEELQEMLNFCSNNMIVSEIELIEPNYIDQAYARTIASDVRYRFVIDIKSWREEWSESAL